MSGRRAAAASRALALLRGRSSSSSSRALMPTLMTTISQCSTSSILPSNAAPLASIPWLRFYSNGSTSSFETSRTFLWQQAQQKVTGTFPNRSAFRDASSFPSPPVRARRAPETTSTPEPSSASAPSPPVDDGNYDADAESDSLTDDERRGRSRRTTSTATAKKKRKSAAATERNDEGGGEEEEEGEEEGSSSSSSFASFSSSSWPGSDVEDEDDAAAPGSFGSFDSDDEEEEEEEDESSLLRERLFETALSEGHVATHGWSNEALSSAAKSLGFSPSAARLAKRGPADLALWFIKKSNDEFRRSLGGGFSADNDAKSSEGNNGKKSNSNSNNARLEELEALPGTTARIEAAIWWRLQPMLPHSGNWHQAVASVALAGPAAAAEAARELWRFCDDAWVLAAGDREPAAAPSATTSSSSYYTKRATLAAVYAACELHLLADYSPGHGETKRSIRRRLSDAAAVAKASKSLLPGSSSNPLASLASEAAARAREAVACGPAMNARRRRREGAAYYSE